MDEKEAKKQHSFRNEKLKATASETEEQRKERLRIRREKDRARRRTKKTTRGKEKVVRNRRPRETDRALVTWKDMELR